MEKMITTTNTRNKLQEMYQKKQLPLPTYQTIRCGGVDHQPLWKSTVTLYNGEQYVGDVCESKTKSDISAASYALTSLNQKKTLIKVCDPPVNQIKSTLMNSNSNISSQIRTAILVDTENLHKFIDEILDRLHEFTVYAFVGEHHCLVNKEYPSGVIKIISPSTRPNGTDTCIQVYTGMLLAQEAYDNYLIATRDYRFGPELVEMISAPNLGWVHKPARLITQGSQL